MNRRNGLTSGATCGMTFAAPDASPVLTPASQAAHPAVASSGRIGMSQAMFAQTPTGKGSPAGPNSAKALALSRRASFIERTDGTSLFYRDWGTGRPVVFIHGAGLCSEMWSYQMMPFVAAGFRCIAFDRRGHGRSSDPGRGYDYDTLADDLAAVLEVLDVNDAVLVGHAMGCGEIVRYLGRHGDSRVSRVALIAPTLPFLLKTPDNPSGVEPAVFESIRAAWLRDFPKWVADNAPPFFASGTSSEMVRWSVDMMAATSLQAVVECNRVAVETDFRKELPRLHKPVLIVHGTADVSAPLEITAKRAAQLIPRSELKVYDGAPHGLFITHMDQLNGDLLSFARA
jgi:non-heme chloroperoxidase